MINFWPLRTFSTLAARLRILPFHRINTMVPSPVAPTDRRPIVISGPSGVGKGTLWKLLLERYPSAFATSISHTTRDPRPGEVRGQDYYYVSMQEFEDLIAKGGFVEHAKFGGNRYGTSRAMIDEMSRKGRVVILDIEMEGVKQTKNTDLNARYVFIAPPSHDVLETRLRGRGTEKEDSIKKRLEQAKHEIEYSKKEGSHDVIIINDDKEKAFEELEAFIFSKEGNQTQQQPAKDGDLAGKSVLD